MSRFSSAGLMSWMVQRISAVYLALFLIYIVIRIALEPQMSYPVWRQWISEPLLNTLLGVFSLSLFGHAWIGARDIILDYVKPLSFRIIILFIIACSLSAMAIWMFRILITAGME